MRGKRGNLKKWKEEEEVGEGEAGRDQREKRDGEKINGRWKILEQRSGD
jgi:hypothetical protein